MPTIRHIVLVVLFSALAGLLQYAAYHFNFYLILVMPLLVGAVVGMAVVIPTMFRPVTTSSLIALALIGGLIASGLYWGARYTGYRDEFAAHIQANSSGMSRDDALALIDQMSRATYGSTGFSAFLADTAASGIGIARLGGSDSAFSLTGAGAYIYWLVEIVVMLAIAIVAVVRRDENKIIRRFRPQEQAEAGPE